MRKLARKADKRQASLLFCAIVCLLFIFAWLNDVYNGVCTEPLPWNQFGWHLCVLKLGGIVIFAFSGFFAVQQLLSYNPPRQNEVTETPQQMAECNLDETHQSLVRFSISALEGIAVDAVALQHHWSGLVKEAQTHDETLGNELALLFAKGLTEPCEFLQVAPPQSNICARLYTFFCGSTTRTEYFSEKIKNGQYIQESEVKERIMAPILTKIQEMKQPTAFSQFSGGQGWFGCGVAPPEVRDDEGDAAAGDFTRTIPCGRCCWVRLLSLSHGFFIASLFFSLTYSVLYFTMIRNVVHDEFVKDESPFSLLVSNRTNLEALAAHANTSTLRHVLSQETQSICNAGMQPLSWTFFMHQSACVMAVLHKGMGATVLLCYSLAACYVLNNLRHVSMQLQMLQRGDLLQHYDGEARNMQNGFASNQPTFNMVQAIQQQWNSRKQKINGVIRKHGRNKEDFEKLKTDLERIDMEGLVRRTDSFSQLV
jgi:hypothetical protein